ncbi:hypothetical protein M413DRAFT_9604 [Hebeloma cylindrosporum]|uniref:Uncharacterized protein n=1 Tax=Hebeloma cylindrosporum TaxID=76867 RepID=A0A0C3CIW0_HEBCY|nr:hypothetical protein M413DRAFT_9604 [Hebeloma cylindrosporum h7]
MEIENFILVLWKLRSIQSGWAEARLRYLREVGWVQVGILHNAPSDSQFQKKVEIMQLFYPTYALPYLDAFMYFSRSVNDSDPGILPVIISTIADLSVSLNDIPNSKRDFLFYHASYYAKSLRSLRFSKPITMPI